MACRKVHITGTFTYADGTPLAGGSVVIKLSNDAQSCSGTLVAAGLPITDALDSNGAMSGTILLYPNVNLVTGSSANVYVLRAYSSQGELNWSSEVTVPNVDPFDVSTVVPI